MIGPVANETEPPATRRAGRVLVVDRRGRILLLSCTDPARPEDGSWWFTPGGGADPGEGVEEAARREAFEETGLVVGALGAPVLTRRASFDFEGLHYEQDEAFFLVRVDEHELDDRSWTEDERRVLTGHRWWSEAELEATSELIYPLGLLELLREAGVYGGPVAPG
jgi:8-oxo-dGTP pyrophosphatase MutT (NUDIX family)